MASLEGTPLVVSEPVVSWLDKLELADRESDDVKETAVKPSKYAGMMIPYIIINGMEISIGMLINMELKASGFLPTLRIKVNDPTNMFTGRHFPKDGDVISLNIRSHNEEVFKPIRIDFDILQVDPIYSTAADAGQSFVITGQMKVPKLYAEECKAYQNVTSYECISTLAEELELGFATNEDGEMQDIMTWINPYTTRIKFMKDVIANAYKDDDSFYSICIDQYYLLNYINMNKLFSTEDDIEQSEVYQMNFGDMSFNNDEDTGHGTSPLLLTNSLQYQGSSNYISKFRMINNSGRVFLTNGYKRYAQWFNIEQDNKNGEFLSEFVDPLTTEGTDELIHLKGRYIGSANNRRPEGIIDDQIKYKWLGKQQAGDKNNVHENFLYSNVLNFQNNQEIYKMGMIIDLDTVNTTLYKYQRVPIIIWDYGRIEKAVYEKAEAQAGTSEELEDGERDNATRPKLNKFLSGFYVITGIDWIYSAPGPIRQRITLVRREFETSA